MHLSYSPGTFSDDRLMSVEEMKESFLGKEIVVTEKLDGENTSMYLDYYHVRSIDSRPHPSQDWCRRLHAMVHHEIPENWRICGENTYAKHSIYYDQLTTFFYVFSIWTDKNVCLSWDQTVEYVNLFNDSLSGTGFSMETVPVLYRGSWNEELVKACWTGRSLYGKEQEGYVVRISDSFAFPVPEESDKNQMAVFKTLAKFVRAKHVQTDDHWRATWEPNKLAGK